MNPVGKIAAPPTPEQRAKDVHEAAVGFEELLLKQILSSAQVIPGGSSGYGAMALDALVSSVARAGGLGLAPKLEHELGKVAKVGP